MTSTRITIQQNFTGVAPGFFSFIGPVAYYKLREQDYGCRYFCDGILSARLFSIFLRRPVVRTSFDYGSIAAPFFEECERRGLRVLVLGGKPLESEAFGKHLSKRFPMLNHRCLDGYPTAGFQDETINTLHSNLTDSKIDVLVLALGSPLQEHVGQQLMKRGFTGTIITAGAFITQTAMAANHGTYYPDWINALHLRFLWRLIHEPHTRSRFKYVLSFPLSFTIDHLRGRVKVSLSTS